MFMFYTQLFVFPVYVKLYVTHEPISCHGSILFLNIQQLQQEILHLSVSSTCGLHLSLWPLIHWYYPTGSKQWLTSMLADVRNCKFSLIICQLKSTADKMTINHHNRKKINMVLCNMNKCERRIIITIVYMHGGSKSNTPPHNMQFLHNQWSDF